MDHHRFDAIARSLAQEDSRRALLKKALGGALGGIAASIGVRGAEAKTRLRAVGNACSTNADCASNLCVQERRGRKTCHCASVADCPGVVDQCHDKACLPTGLCGATVKTGTGCDDGNLCTTNDQCQANGTCAGAPVVCTPLDACHTAGTCDPGSGQCSNPVKQPVDCVLSAWSDWSACPVKCGSGTQTRTRTVVTPASCGGAACQSLTDSQACSASVPCGACTQKQLDSLVCSTYTFTDNTQICTGGGIVCGGSCATDADCPSYWPWCLVSYTLALTGNALETCSPTPGCSTFGPCSVSAA